MNANSETTMPKWNERVRGGGQFRKSPACDGCGKPCGTVYLTDEEVCGNSDGPGFYICNRARCPSRKEATIEERRALYTTQRAKNDAK